MTAQQITHLPIKTLNYTIGQVVISPKLWLSLIYLDVHALLYRIKNSSYENKEVINYDIRQFCESFVA